MLATRLGSVRMFGEFQIESIILVQLVFVSLQCHSWAMVFKLGVMCGSSGLLLSLRYSTLCTREKGKCRLDTLTVPYNLKRVFVLSLVYEMLPCVVHLVGYYKLNTEDFCVSSLCCDFLLFFVLRLHTPSALKFEPRCGQVWLPNILFSLFELKPGDAPLFFVSSSFLTSN